VLALYNTNLLEFHSASFVQFTNLLEFAKQVGLAQS
jgi:hypothetical protein